MGKGAKVPFFWKIVSCFWTVHWSNEPQERELPKMALDYRPNPTKLSFKGGISLVQVVKSYPRTIPPAFGEADCHSIAALNLNKLIILHFGGGRIWINWMNLREREILLLLHFDQGYKFFIRNSSNGQIFSKRLQYRCWYF